MSLLKTLSKFTSSTPSKRPKLKHNTTTTLPRSWYTQTNNYNNNTDAIDDDKNDDTDDDIGETTKGVTNDFELTNPNWCSKKIKMDFSNWDNINKDGRESSLPFYLFRECHYRDWYEYVPSKISQLLVCSKFNCWRPFVINVGKFVKDIPQDFRVSHKLESIKITRPQQQKMEICNKICVVLHDWNRSNYVTTGIDCWELEMQKLRNLQNNNVSAEFINKCITLSLYYFTLFFSENLPHIELSIQIFDTNYSNFYRHQLESVLKEQISSAAHLVYK